ncbi:CpsD/CapB family tyrosine-protein kinase [Vulcanibacillus modesticaldus]|uniref:CpsD/CapB family tyrosine-protein kinase n=1 Tax=Vulcanibacillus modesticaldus TaxID=337097 RepID=UPI000AE0DD86|nr:CpsD/CapB family tyrosine-protein kinase [Vulcanibacillus modesticaldus]
MKFKTKGKTKRERKLITIYSPKSPISESFRTLRTNIQFASIDQSLKTLMVTSTGPGEGKSTIIANLAVVLAQQEKKVLLVDADMRKPTVHHTFRLPNLVGLTNVLVGNEVLEDAIQETTVNNLNILTSGPIPPNPAELLGSNRMSQLVDEVSSTYDIVLFDAPPVIAVTDAQVLSRIIDGVLLVVHSGKTHREMAIKSKELLENVRANVIGVVLNHKEVKGENYYYYYYGEN